MTNMETFFGIICIIQSFLLYFSAVRNELKDKLLEARRLELISANNVINAGQNYKNAADAYIVDLEKKVDQNYKAAIMYKEKCQRFEKFVGSIPDKIN